MSPIREGDVSDFVLSGPRVQALRNLRVRPVLRLDVSMPIGLTLINVAAGLLLMCLGGALFIPKVQQRFIQHFGEAQDAWGLPRTRAPRFTATAGALMVFVSGVAMIVGAWSD